jgi:hypothetical protein
VFSSIQPKSSGRGLPVAASLCAVLNDGIEDACNLWAPQEDGREFPPHRAESGYWKLQKVPQGVALW